MGQKGDYDAMVIGMSTLKHGTTQQIWQFLARVSDMEPHARQGDSQRLRFARPYCANLTVRCEPPGNLGPI